MASSYPMLRYGSSGQEVRRLQQALNRAGYSLEVDGGFGEKTRAALMDYQRRAGMTPDGVAGSKTWASLGLQSAQDRLAGLEKGYTPPGRPRRPGAAGRSWRPGSPGTTPPLTRTGWRICCGRWRAGRPFPMTQAGTRCSGAMPGCISGRGRRPWRTPWARRRA
ncbi:MAG: peptidoglycan-binding domain-containing protein [Oscillospiraceae bacterium]